MAMADEKVLSYGDVLLRRSDVDLLNGPYYLNDAIIEFFFAYLGSSCPPCILLIPPAISFWIVYTPDADSRISFVQPLCLPEREIVMFAINNNENMDIAGGGSHWSLLVYHRRNNVYEHFDSMSGINWRHANALVSVIKSFMGCTAASAVITEAFTPQQENGYDCGVYVMAIAESICKAFQQKGENYKKGLTAFLKAQVTSDSVCKMRHSTKELILSLANTGRREQ
eukprot:c24247_g1_i2 orf=110-787(+)